MYMQLQQKLRKLLRSAHLLLSIWALPLSLSIEQTKQMFWTLETNSSLWERVSYFLLYSCVHHRPIKFCPQYSYVSNALHISHSGAFEGSKKKFALIAKKFFTTSRKKRKGAGKIIRDAHGPSTLNLLDDNDDEDLIDATSGLHLEGSDHVMFEPLVGTHQLHNIVQSSFDKCP